ncbi:MAG: hypothetical protein WCT29_00060 [Candidatus Paceibacterota bacterium]|jgi:hypothetical protein
MENNKRLPLIIVIGALIIGNVFFGLAYFSQKGELDQLRDSQSKAIVNEKVLDFTSMFVKKVLQAEREVDFETRLSLENAVRDLKDEEIMKDWQNFVNSKTETEAQNSVKKLLEVLVGKIQK